MFEAARSRIRWKFVLAEKREGRGAPLPGIVSATLFCRHTSNGGSFFSTSSFLSVTYFGMPFSS